MYNTRLYSHTHTLSLFHSYIPSNDMNHTPTTETDDLLKSQQQREMTYSKANNREREREKAETDNEERTSTYSYSYDTIRERESDDDYARRRNNNNERDAKEVYSSTPRTRKKWKTE